MRSILIVDFSVYREGMVKMFQDLGYRTDHCESAYDAMAKLKSFDYDLVVSEVELPGDNAFDLYNYIRANYPFLPTIMTTDKRIDTFFDRIFKEGIGNVLCKPIRREVIVTLADKLITRNNIFGLANYLQGLKETKRVRITKSRQIQGAIGKILEEIERWGLPVVNRMSLSLMLNELAINAVYHSHGFTREKEDRLPVELREGESVDIFFARSDTQYAFSINDYKGMLTTERILASINGVLEQEQIINQAAETGEDVTDFVSETGRGIDLVRKLAGDYYFIIKKDVRTEIILIFDITPLRDDVGRYSSLRIIEDR
ncbi:MAG: response regulator [Spirochaetes bacterium]|nr:response regulator [Spirochaetota bacterium]